MQQNASPIVVSIKTQLSNFGVDPANCKPGVVTMESAKYICARQGNELKIISLADSSVQSMSMDVDSAIMNPVTKVLAVRGKDKQLLEVWNIDMKSKTKSVRMNEQVRHWCWLSANLIGIVTDNAVYHWSLAGSENPKPVFQRMPELSGCRIVSYDCAKDGSWCALVGWKKNASNQIEGCIQLFSKKASGGRGASNFLKGHAALFVDVENGSRTVFAFVQHDVASGQPPRIVIKEISAPKEGRPLLQGQMVLPWQDNTDFAMSLTAANTFDILYLSTKNGQLFVIDIATVDCFFSQKIFNKAVFVAAADVDSTSILAITATEGRVLSIDLNRNVIVGYLLHQLGKTDTALGLAMRGNLPGAEQVLSTKFEEKLRSFDYKGASSIVAKAPALRTVDTIRRFQSLPQQAGQQVPVMIYFATLLDMGKLNHIESVEIARIILSNNRTEILKKWLSQDKLECSEALGDMCYQGDAKMALSIYLKANAPEKVINCFIQLSSYADVVKYCRQSDFRPDFHYILQNLVRRNPEQAVELAKVLADPPTDGSIGTNEAPWVDVEKVSDVFLQMNAVQQCTEFLLAALAKDREEDAHLQTRCIEINLLGNSPRVAEAILTQGMFSHFDKPHIASLCEQSCLYQQALELHSDISDIKRCVVHTAEIPKEFLVEFFSRLSREHAMICLRELIQNPQNQAFVVAIAQKICTVPDVPEAAAGEEVPSFLGCTAVELIELFDDFKDVNGLYYFLGSIVNNMMHASVHFKYIEICVKVGNMKEVERICRDSTAYDAEQVKSYLIDSKLADARPLIHVCDRHGFIEDLVGYLHSANPPMDDYIQVYVEKVSPHNTPRVIGKLLDMDANEDFIKRILSTVKGDSCSIADLVHEVDTRNRLRMLQPWLEQRIAEGNTEVDTHNAIGKLYIRLNKDPKSFLIHNQYYDSKVLGPFCEKLDPFLSFLAYKRGGEPCDTLLVECCQRNGLYKDMARYLVERQSIPFWMSVLLDQQFTPSPEDENQVSNEDKVKSELSPEALQHRQSLIDEVISTALPECQNADAISTTVRAFMEAELPGELISLLEKLVLGIGGMFTDNKNLQNLLLLTAIRSDTSKVMDFIQRLDNYEDMEIARICRDYNLYEEAYEIYRKFDRHKDAVEVLLDEIESTERGLEYAERVNLPEVWSLVGKAQLKEGLVNECIESFIKANDSDSYKDVISAAQLADEWSNLVAFLQMARKQTKDKIVDTELAFAYAKTDKLADLEEMVNTQNLVDIQSLGDRCFDEGMFEAAKIAFKVNNNNGRLAQCFVELKQYAEAVEAARQANGIKTWKYVCKACLLAGKFKEAKKCGENIIVNPDHLEELIFEYENLGYFDELIDLMETGLGLESAHTGIFTELGVLYSKHRPEKLMPHLTLFWTRMNTQRMLRCAEEARLWSETCYLYTEIKEYDQAAKCMMEHSSSAWNHDKFLLVIGKVRNVELHYKAINFYLEEAPARLIKTLSVLQSKLDHTRVVSMFNKAQQIPLIMPYLKAVQNENVSAVNEAVNECYVEEENYASLRESISTFDNFDQLTLAQRIEKHELLEFRRIAAQLYRQNGRYAQSVSISKQDKMYKDAIDTAAQSGEKKLAEELLVYFLENDDKECFSAMLYTCYGLISPDVALELAWKHGILDFAMPFLIQLLKDTTEKVKELDERTYVPEPEKVEPQGGPLDMMQGTLQLANSAYNPGMQPMMQQPGMIPMQQPPMQMQQPPMMMQQPPMMMQQQNPNFMAGGGY